MTAGIGAAAVRGVFWTGAGQVLRQAIQVIGSVVLARLLVPDDFGLLGMAMFFVGIGQLFADFGIGSAIIHGRESDRTVLSTCFWLNLAIAAALALIVLVTSPVIAAFYKRDDLTPLLGVLSLNLVLAGLQAVPQALLYRDMRFVDLAWTQVLGSFSGAVVAITLASRGAGVWSLVAQPLAGSSISLLAVMLALRWRPHFEFSWARVAPLWRYSMAMLGTSLVGFGNRNFDSLLVGRFLGAGPLGLYSMAIQLMLYPMQQVSSVVVRVLFPTLVQIRDDLPRLRTGYLRAVGGIALITFPMMGGLFAVADDFVAVVFGPGWAEMAPVLKVVAWVGMFQSVGTTVGTLFLSKGRPDLALRVNLVSAPVFVAGMIMGLPWGILGVATGYSIASFSLFYYVARKAFALVDLSMADFHRAVFRPLVSTLAMIAIVSIAIRLPAFASLTPLLRLCAGITCGVVAYGLISMCIDRKQIREISGLLSALRAKRGS